MDLKVDEKEFMEWCAKYAEMGGFYFDAIKEKYGDRMSQKIKEINWQVHKIDESHKKIMNILDNSDFIGKLLSMFLKEKHKEELEMYRRAEHE